MFCQYPQPYFTPPPPQAATSAHFNAIVLQRRRCGDIPVVSKLLGHRKIEMTMRYTHASNTDAEAAAERIGKQIAALLEGRAVAGEATQTRGKDGIRRT